MKDLAITITLAVIMSLNMIDVITDINLGVPMWHIIEESIIVLASALGVIYLVLEMNRRTKQLDHLAETLSNADRRLKNITDEMKNARRPLPSTVNAAWMGGTNYPPGSWKIF